MNGNKPESRIFLIADTHFGDENIRLYEERPFPDTDTMDREMIRRWNSVVGDNDLVYHLGDFCSGGQNRCRELLSQLKGRKRLLIGNHISTAVRLTGLSAAAAPASAWSASTTLRSCWKHSGICCTKRSWKRKITDESCRRDHQLS